MVRFRPGSHVVQLITLLSFAGEFPVSSLALLGNERVLKALVHRLTGPQLIRGSRMGMEMQSRVFTISGKGRVQTVRLYKGALPILDWLHSGAYAYYRRAFWNHRFPGDSAHRERNSRVAEAAALCMRAGIEARPYLLPRLQNREILRVMPELPCFYLARDLKRVGEAEMNKTMFTRMVGTIFAHGRCYAVYNTRNAAMKWSGMGEFKALYSLIELARLNAGITGVEEAVLIGRSEDIALKTLVESDKKSRLEFRFDVIYRYVYFIAMNGDGIRQLAMLTVPDWKERLLELLFEPDTRSYDKGLFEYDACVEGVYILSHLDGDLARLIRFREGIEGREGSFEVLCFPHQTEFLREYLGEPVRLRVIDREVVERELGLVRRDLFGKRVSGQIGKGGSLFEG